MPEAKDRHSQELTEQRGIKGGRSPNLCPFAFFLNFESTYLGGEHFNMRVAMFNLFDFYYYLMLLNGLP